MANSISYYKTLITDSYVTAAAQVGVSINPAAWSVVNLERCLIYAVAVCAWTVDTLMDLFKSDVNETIAAMKPHSLRWYAEKAKAFQYGFALVDDTDGYNNADVDADVIAASKVVAYAAVVEQERGLRIKVAKNNGATLAPLSNAELAAFVYYMKEVKDAGVKLNITTGIADALKLDVEIIYNPLVLNASGSRVDGIATSPVQTAIKNYLKNLPFNGILSLQKLIDEVQKVEGVEDLKLNSAMARYGLLPFAGINIIYQPDSGYLSIDEADLTLTFTAA